MRQGQAEGGGGADQRGAAHLHGAYGVSGFAHSGEAEEIQCDQGRLRLVDDSHRPPCRALIDPDAAVGGAVDFHVYLPRKKARGSALDPWSVARHQLSGVRCQTSRELMTDPGPRFVDAERKPA